MLRETRKTSEGLSSLTLLVAALTALLTLPRLLSRGMFVDGMVYATIARNLAMGVGTPWHVSFTPSMFSEFVEHPPLGFWIQALFFRVLGDGTAVESVFSATMGLAFVGALSLVWRSLPLGKKVGFWWPWLLLLAMPLVTWGFDNNLLENIVGVFTSLAVAAALQGVFSLRWERQVLWGVAAGLGVAAGVLTKGPVALFPLATPVIAALFLREARRTSAALTTVAMGLALLAIGIVLWNVDEAAAYLHTYFEQQVSASVRGERFTRSSRWYIIRKIFEEALLGPAVVSAGVAVLTRHWRLSIDRYTLCLGAIALSASLPIAISPKQNAFYLLPSLPLFAACIAAAFRSAGQTLQDRAAATPHRQRMIHRAGWVMGLLAVIGLVGGRHLILNHPDFHRDFTVQPLAIPPGEVAAVCPTSIASFTFRSAMARHFQLDLKTKVTSANWWITTLGAQCELPPGCQLHHPPEAHRYQLYRCQPGS